MAEEIYLTQYGLMAERHWRDSRLTMVREMEANRTLIEALFEAQETTINEMEALTRQFETEQKLAKEKYAFSSAARQKWAKARTFRRDSSHCIISMHRGAPPISSNANLRRARKARTRSPNRHFELLECNQRAVDAKKAARSFVSPTIQTSRGASRPSRRRD